MWKKVVIFLLIWDSAYSAKLISRLDRESILDAEKKHRTGGNAYLTEREAQANDIVTRLRSKILLEGITNSTGFAPAMHFFQAKPLIESSPIFRMLKAMPKGSVLHLHNTAAVSSKWVIKNLTYRSEAKLCEVNGTVFFTVRQSKFCDSEPQKSITKLRAQNASAEAFDLWLESFINLKLRDPELMHTDVNTVWNDFQQIFDALKDLLMYKPFFEDYHRQMLREFYDDNVQYIELRASLSKVYDANGKNYNEFEIVKMISDIVESFKKDHPDFFGVKIIYAKHRSIDNETVESFLEKFITLNQEFPDLVVGFDLVGQEDINNPLILFTDKLRKFEKTAPYFFHAGETNGYGSEADLNLVDAVLLNSRRIGHGYSLYKHPVLWKMVKQKGIALEICPLSNQVLRLVTDMRNHPAVFYVSESVPIVIAPDDPGFWDSVAVGFDFYYALMSLAPHSAGIGFLKQIVWDSVKYSTLTEPERTQYAELLQPKWEAFLDFVIANKVLNY
ncbi:hypothetical protein quinque_012158 [Culex quinquefasciatus]